MISTQRHWRSPIRPGIFIAAASHFDEFEFRLAQGMHAPHQLNGSRAAGDE
jgi:hypothetical protein